MFGIPLETWKIYNTFTNDLFLSDKAVKKRHSNIKPKKAKRLNVKHRRNN